MDLKKITLMVVCTFFFSVSVFSQVVPKPVPYDGSQSQGNTTYYRPSPPFPLFEPQLSIWIENPQKYYRDGIENVTQIISQNPTDETLYYLRGNGYCEVAEYSNAIADFTIALRIKPDYVDALERRASTYHRIGNLDMAIKDYAELTERYISSKSDWFRNLGSLYKDKGDYTRAIEILTSSLLSFPYDASRLLWERAEVFERMGNIEQAIADYTTVLHLNPGRFDAKEWDDYFKYLRSR